MTIISLNRFLGPVDLDLDLEIRFRRTAVTHRARKAIQGGDCCPRRTSLRCFRYHELNTHKVTKSLDGSTEHSVLTPLTIPASGLPSTHGIFSFCQCYLSLVHLLLLCAA